MLRVTSFGTTKSVVIALRALSAKITPNNDIVYAQNDIFVFEGLKWISISSLGFKTTTETYR